MFNAEQLLSVLLFLFVLGSGFWFNRSGWPWLTRHLEKQQELKFAIEQQRMEAEVESDRRWQETASAMSQNFASLQAEMAENKALLRVMVDAIERLFRYMVKVNGNDPGS